jgi:hypothetical protein
MEKAKLSILDSGVARPTKKLEGCGSKERRGRYFGDANTNITKYVYY